MSYKPFILNISFNDEEGLIRFFNDDVSGPTSTRLGCT